MRVGRGGRTESFDPTKRRIPTPVCTPRALASRRALARNDRERDVEDAVPYTLRHCEEYPKGTCFAARSDAAIRSPRHKETDSRAGDTGGQNRPPLRGGTSRTPSPTHSVIARSEATRQSVLPSPKKRIPAPVTRSLARNDSAPRWERRDTWVPPYGVRQSSRAGRVVRPYKAEQEPCETGRRGRRPLRNHKGGVQRGGWRRPPLQRDGGDGVPYE